MPTVRDILALKGNRVHTIAPGATVMEAVESMNRHRIGAILVMDAGRLTGILTERDILQRVVGVERSPRELFVGECMTTDVACCDPDDDIEDVSAIMRDRRVRHLPVCEEDGGVIGLISIGDVNAQFTTMQAAQLSQLSEYVYGRA